MFARGYVPTTWGLTVTRLASLWDDPSGLYSHDQIPETGMTNSSPLNMAIDSEKMLIFHTYVNVYQKVEKLYS